MKKSTMWMGMAILLASATAWGAPPDEAPLMLRQEFAAPPTAARPWVFWWFEGGYGGKEGMARDIDAMREKGIGGVMHMQTVDTTGLLTDDLKPAMLGEAWADWFGEAARLAAQAGMTFSASIVDGWAFGGQWVDKEDAAMMLVSSELQVDGASDLAQPLPLPFNRLGVYHDVAVIAFPEKPGRPQAPAMVRGSHTVQGYCAEENWPAAHAVDGDPYTYWRSSISPSEAAPVWLQCDYPQPLTAMGVYLRAMPGGGVAQGELQVSDDEQSFRTVVDIILGPGEEQTIGFPEVQGHSFRLLITSAHVPDTQLAEFQVLRPGDQPLVRQGIKWWEYKSGNRGILVEGSMDEVNPFHQQGDLKSAEVIDLSDRLRPDGRLDWQPPSAECWTVMRFGWTTIGQPARMSAGGGYEVDVLSTRSADLMFDNAATRMLEVAQKTAPGAMKVFHTDSWEIGADVQGQQPTWTPDFRAQFQKRRGYDLLPLLPAMARRIVDDSETTERFLFDYRATIADLVADYYGRLQQRAHERQTLMNPESGYGSYPSPHLDGLKVFGRADLPMAEVAHNDAVENLSMAMGNPFVDALRTAASGARIYGRQLVQAETLTYHPWLGQVTAPDRYRKTLNYCFANGLNQAVIHKYVHQPFEYKPGLEDYGIFSRHSTWWPMAEGMLQYIGRCQYLLQQGQFVADVAYFVGEGSSRYVPSKSMLKPALPTGCDFDGMNAEVLLTRLSVKDGRWTLPDGLSYRYLVLAEPYCSTMSAEVLARLCELVEAGATLVGQPPTRTPGLANRTEAESQIKELVTRLWGAEPAERGLNHVGRGRVAWGWSLDKLMEQDDLPADAALTAQGPDGAQVPQRAGLAQANWIWHDLTGWSTPPGERYFRACLDVPAGQEVLKALVSMTADNEFILTVNGTECLRSTSIQPVADADITGLVKAGRNDISLSAVNITNEPSPAGLIGKFVVTLSDGQTTELHTNTDQWQSSADGEQWQVPSLAGPLGCAPWGAIDPTAVAGLDWIHRRNGQTDIYFLANPTNEVRKLLVTLRAAGRVPELFDPLTGEARVLPQYAADGRLTTIPMRFEPYQGLFVLFREAVPEQPPVPTEPNFYEYRPLMDVSGPWTVQFDPVWVSPALGDSGEAAQGLVVFDRLIDWTERPEPGLQHYSGLVTYRTTFILPEHMTADARARLCLSLGEVRSIARVRLNGRDLGVVWCEPWQVALGGACQQGLNQLEVDVANLWANRVIGDAGLPAAERLTRSNFQLGADTPLYSSGLLGPVRLLEIQTDSPTIRR